MLINPADAFRLLNLTGFEGLQVPEQAWRGLAGEVAPPMTALAGALLLWTALPLSARHAGLCAEGAMRVAPLAIRWPPFLFATDGL